MPHFILYHWPLLLTSQCTTHQDVPRTVYLRIMFTKPKDYINIHNIRYRTVCTMQHMPNICTIARQVTCKKKHTIHLGGICTLWFLYIVVPHTHQMKSAILCGFVVTICIFSAFLNLVIFQSHAFIFIICLNPKKRYENHLHGHLSHLDHQRHLLGVGRPFNALLGSSQGNTGSSQGNNALPDHSALCSVTTDGGSAWCGGRALKSR